MCDVEGLGICLRQSGQFLSLATQRSVLNVTCLAAAPRLVSNDTMATHRLKQNGRWIAWMDGLSGYWRQRPTGKSSPVLKAV